MKLIWVLMLTVKKFLVSEAMAEELAVAMVGGRGGTPVHGRLRLVEMVQPGANDACWVRNYLSIKV